MAAIKTFGSALREVRFFMCQNSGASAGAREFVTKYYKQVKTANPTLPLLIRESSSTPATIYARYGMGRETSISVDGKTADEIRDILSQLGEAQ